MAKTTAGNLEGPVRQSGGSPPLAVYNRWCKGCGICVEFCPRKVLKLSADGKAIVAYPEKCTLCRLCEVLCPDFAITVTNKDEKPSSVALGGEPVARGRVK
jgi:2-oxoglutarate ferredoxin oxidoreductase subunit delta